MDLTFPDAFGNRELLQSPVRIFIHPLGDTADLCQSPG